MYGELNNTMKIGIANDHAGCELKRQIVEYLKNELNISAVNNFGADIDKSVDYPDYAKKVVAAIESKNIDYGIVANSITINALKFMDTDKGLLRIQSDSVNNELLNGIYKGDMSISFWFKLLSPHASPGNMYSRILSLFNDKILIGGHYSYTNNVSIDISSLILKNSSSWIKNTILEIKKYHHCAIIIEN